ncbi:MAG: type II secretion system protein [Candidatus Sumerlaeia bacterium]|nr:type II secretion system protein [Candidatus Sumerlaeia bacterium]
MRQRGFTLIELLIVVAILAISSAALMYPTTHTMREQRLADERHGQEAGLAMAMPQLVSDVRAARRVSPLDGGHELERADGARVRYSVDARGLLVRDAEGASQALVPNVEAFSILRTEGGARIRIAGGAEFAGLPARFDRSLTVSTIAVFEEGQP